MDQDIKMNFNFEIDTTWCLEQLHRDGRISERDKLLVQTTHRQREQLKWHPLQWICHFNFLCFLLISSTLPRSSNSTPKSNPSSSIAAMSLGKQAPPQP